MSQQPKALAQLEENILNCKANDMIREATYLLHRLRIQRSKDQIIKTAEAFYFSRRLTD